MASNGPSVPLIDFSKGLNTFDPEYSSPLNQSPDLDNLIILDKGFKKRNGDSAWNSSAMVSSATAVHGLGYVKFNNGVEFLNAITGTKFFTDSGLSGTMTDATGSVSITIGQDNLWVSVIYNNLQIWFGGAPDAPFKYSGSGVATALGGSPPSAANAFVANNRVFGISTAANPSRILWTVLGTAEDWTGTGSGSADVLLSDGESLQCGVITGPDTAILFKNTSSHLMVLTRAPFPIYQLQKGNGVAGKNAWCYANGTIFIVTPGLRMKSTTDGVNFQTYPNDINDIWDSISPNRVSFIQGIYYQPLEWVMWFVSIGSSTTNNYLIVWDIKRQCFLRCTIGFKSNITTLMQNRRLMAGHYDGKVYEKLKATIFSDASESSPGAINGYWRTPFSSYSQDIDTVVHPFYVDIVALTESASTLTVSYGFDFTSPSKGQTFTLQAVGSLWDVALWDQGVWGGQNATVLTQFISGRGNLFSFIMGNNTASQGFTVQGTMVRLRKSGARKVFLGI